MKFKKVLILFILVILFTTPVNIYADDLLEREQMEGVPEEAMMPAKPAEESMEQKDINSFEYFWPVVAGKVDGERFYSLKKLKESIQGLLIFNNVSKAEYNSFLTTKRMVEAEKLINEGEIDKANKTLERARGSIEKTNKYSRRALDSKTAFGEDGPLIVDRMGKISTFAAWLSVAHTDYSQKLMEISKAATDTKTALE